MSGVWGALWAALRRALRGGEWLTLSRATGYAVILAVMLAAGAGVAIRARLAAAASDPLHRPVMTDFVAFYAAGRMVLQGTPALAYDPAATDRAQHAIAQLSGGYLGFYYPPPLLAACAAVALLPFGWAWLVWEAALFAPLALALWRMAAFGGRAAGRLRWMLLASPAVVMTAANGQTGFIAAGAMAWAGLLLAARPALAGACLSLALVKPHMALAAPVMLLAGRNWRAVLGMACGGCAILAVTLPVTGYASWLAFLRTTPAAEAALTTFAPHWHKLLSVMTLLRVVGVPVGVAGLAQAAVSAALLGLVGWLAWVSRGGQRGVALMAVAAAATPLISPHVLDYDLPVLLAPMAYVAGCGLREGWRDWDKLGLAMLYALPLLARPLTFGAGLPVGPFCLAAGLALTWRRAWAAAGGPGGPGGLGGGGLGGEGLGGGGLAVSPAGAPAGSAPAGAPGGAAP